MKRYQYVGGPDHDQWFQGLPSVDLDDNQLDDPRRELMKIAVFQGIFKDTESPTERTIYDEPTSHAPIPVEGTEETDAHQASRG